MGIMDWVDVRSTKLCICGDVQNLYHTLTCNYINTQTNPLYQNPEAIASEFEENVYLEKFI